MAPDHGEDDFALCKAHGIDPVFAVEDDGKYREDWLWLGGQGSVINAKFNAPDGPICTDLREAGGLLAAQRRFPAQLPALLALQGQGHLPLHPAMVHPDGPAAARQARETFAESGGTMKAAPFPVDDADAARVRIAGHRRHPLDPREGPQPLPLDGRGPGPTG